jgi:coenzyme Q-binding protein COQ10
MVLLLIQKRIIFNIKPTIITECCCFERKLITFQTPKVDNSNVSYKEKKVLGYPKEYIFDIVKDVKRYREFVPWCLKSDILPLDITTQKQQLSNEQFNLQLPESFKARLEVGYPPIKESYISNVTFIKPKLVKTVAIKTTFFDYINAEWKFYSYDHVTNKVILKDDPNIKYQCCLVEFYVTFKFRSTLYSQFSSLFLDNIFKKMVTAFTKRAFDLHGPSKIVFTK